VCEKDGYCMTWVAELVKQVCKVFTTAADKCSFIQSLENMFSEATLEMYEAALAGELPHCSGGRCIASMLNQTG